MEPTAIELNPARTIAQSSEESCGSIAPGIEAKTITVNHGKTSAVIGFTNGIFKKFAIATREAEIRMKANIIDLAVYRTG